MKRGYEFFLLVAAFFLMVGIILLLPRQIHEGKIPDITRLSLEEILQKANEYSLQVKSGKILLCTEARFLKDPQEDFIEEVKLWFDGVRSRQEKVVNRPKTKDVTVKHEVFWVVFDGKQVIETTSPERRTQALVATPRDLSELDRYVGGVKGIFPFGPALNRVRPLGKEIAAYEGKLVGTEKIGDLTCLRIDALPRGPGNWQVAHSWWLAPSKKYALVKKSEIVTWPLPKTTAKSTPQEKPKPSGPVCGISSKVEKRRNVTLVKEWLQTPDGIWLPKIVSYRVYIKDRGAGEELRRVEHIKLVSAEINILIPGKVFQLKLAKDTKIIPMER